MQLDLNSGILLIGIVQGVFLAIFLFTNQKGLATANRYLACLLVAFVFALAVHFLKVTELWQQWLYLYLFGSVAVFAFGPLLYFYVRALTQPQKPVQWLHSLHLLPLVINLLLFLSYLSAPEGQIVAAMERASTEPKNSINFLPLLKIGLITVYTLAAFKLWFAHNHRIRAQFSDIEQKSLLWLRNLLLGFLCFEGLFLVIFSADLDISKVPGQVDTLLSLVLIAMIFMTGFYGLQQPEVFRNHNREKRYQGEQAKFEDREKTDKASSKNLNPELEAQIKQRLERTMNSDKVYLDRFLDLNKLADHLDVTSHQISEYLNRVLEMNFYDFINLQRIEEAKRQLINSQDSILDIALAVGFNNKTTFNKAFKKYSNMTPSQYRKSHLS
ncbi:helix-turn-helix domain-containing protein [Planctobacterium marinum]|uniref:HTH araC/xylS-type domain-containing protein n=1 Tax=Planctobacterium marinum TaxID=1631968 RepID=A0AA48KQW4_9ALTE|nr:hypothetical protein MACH26_03550 [Planctobacterium marinum]